MPRAVSAGLEIPLLPSPLARRVGRLFVVLQAVYGLELLLRGHWVVAALITGIGLLAWLRRQRGPQRRQRPRRLLLAADGRLHVLTVDGGINAVRLHPSSLRLGPWLILVLNHAGHKPYRLLLGPDNLDEAMLAALRRRMVLVDQLAEAVMPGLQTQPANPWGARTDAAKQHERPDPASLR